MSFALVFLASTTPSRPYLRRGYQQGQDDHQEQQTENDGKADE